MKEKENAPSGAAESTYFNCKYIFLCIGLLMVIVKVKEKDTENKHTTSNR